MIAAAYIAEKISTSGVAIEMSVNTQSVSNTLAVIPAAETNMSRVESKVPHSTSSKLEVEPVVIDRWDAEKNLRYKQLARDEAMRDLSIQELAELETLTRLRRFAKYPRSADEILWDRRQQKVTRSLVNAVQQYVDFHETPHHS